MPLIISSCEKNNGILVFKKKIDYKVEGTATEIIVTYTDDKGDIKKAGIAPKTTPWKLSFSVKSDAYLYLQAKNMTSMGYVQVEISKKGKLLFSDYNNNPYGSATASGFLK